MLGVLRQLRLDHYNGLKLPGEFAFFLPVTLACMQPPLPESLMLCWLHDARCGSPQAEYYQLEEEKCDSRRICG
jgi:hypothetical protein